jgi:monoamine oxidase
MASMNAAYDVLILGAGAAGLAAARVLGASGRRVAVIEARDRIGGRIYTRQSKLSDGSSFPVELGAEFVHGLPAESWRLIAEANLATYELDGSRLTFAGGQLQPTASGHEVSDVLGCMVKWLSEQADGADLSFAQYLDRVSLNARQRDDAVRYVEGFNAADHKLIGIAALAKQQQAEDLISADRIFHVRDGYDKVAQFLRDQILAEGGSLFLGKPISSVEWRAGGVTMSGTDASGQEFSFTGTQAVITLPLGVLQTGNVRFTPAPRQTLAEAARMTMGPVVRVPLIFRSRWWRDKPALDRHPALAHELSEMSFLFCDTDIPRTWWTSNPDVAPMIVGWAAGPTAANARQDVRDQCLRTLARVFDLPLAVLTAELTEWHYHDWNADEFARGAYSYVPAGALSAPANIAEPVSETLFFAGEHTVTSGHWGTVHGALQSGESAAAKIIATPNYR